ncbi:MAG: ABC transporter permease [Halolamina sp.]
MSRDRLVGAADVARRGLRRLVALGPVERLLISLAALALSIVCGAAIVLVAGRAATCQSAATTLAGVGFCYDPVEVFSVLFNGAFSDSYAVARTLQSTTLLVFTGLSVAVAFRAGLFNIGTQGQMVLGALGTALAVEAVVPFVPATTLGTAVLAAVGLVVGTTVGAAYGVVPGLLKAYADANEVVTTIMLNFVASNVAFVLVSLYFRNQASQSVETTPLPEYARLLPRLFPTGAKFSVAVLGLALALVVGVYALVEHTSLGYDIRVSGRQPEAAEYGGVDAAATTVKSFGLSGGLGGVAGAVYVLMVQGKWLEGMPALGFDGITVSILAGNNPLGVGLAALLFGVLKSGSFALGFQTDVPPELAGVLRGLIILFVAMPEFFRLVGTRVVDLGPSRSEDAVATDGGESR